MEESLAVGETRLVAAETDLHTTITCFISPFTKTDYYKADFCRHNYVAFQMIGLDLKHSGDGYSL